MGWIKAKKRRALWHKGALTTACGLPVYGEVFFKVDRPEDLGKVCYKCRVADERSRSLMDDKPGR